MKHTANYQILPLAGTMTLAGLGNGLTANTVHRIYCITAGAIVVTAMGGGTATFTMVAKDFIDIIPKALTVSSGLFIGFKAKWPMGNYPNA